MPVTSTNPTGDEGCPTGSSQQTSSSSNYSRSPASSADGVKDKSERIFLSEFKVIKQELDDKIVKCQRKLDKAKKKADRYLGESSNRIDKMTSSRDNDATTKTDESGHHKSSGQGNQGGISGNSGHDQNRGSGSGTALASVTGADCPPETPIEPQSGGGGGRRIKYANREKQIKHFHKVYQEKRKQLEDLQKQLKDLRSEVEQPTRSHDDNTKN